jgi:uroporphyrinogen decarboxylase
LDKIEILSGNLFISPGFEEKIIKETETTNIIINSMGLMAEVPKNDHSTIPHYMKSSIETPDDWKRIKEEHFRRDDPDRIVDIEKAKKDHPDDRDYPLGVNTGSMIGRVRDMLTFEGLAYACFDYPDMVEDMVETACVLAEDFLDQVLPHFEFEYAAGWEDICFNHGPIVSVDFFKNVVTPRYKRINKKLKKFGIDVWFTDCDGDVRPILPYFLEGGINCLFPYEVNSCSHPAELLAEYGKDLMIMGGFDKMQLIAGKEAIKEYMKTLEPLVERGGYIPFCDHRCPPDVTVENYLYYLDLKEKTFGMK